MPPRKKKELPDERLRIENFYKRWNIELSDKDRWTNFRNRILNAYSSEIAFEIMTSTKSEIEFFKLLGLHTNTLNNPFDISISSKLIESPTYLYFYKENDIKKFILGLEVIFWMTSIDWKYKLEFLESIQDAIIETGVPLIVKDTDDCVLFFPAGAKLLDQALVNDNLDWLADFPDSYDTFKIALTEIGTKGKERHVVDNLRLSLELLLKAVLKNTKSLENQKEFIGKYLKTRNTSSEISNLFWTVLDYYSKYQNDKIKHTDNAKADEVEFLLYLTGTIMRFLLTK